ncbi:MAG: cyclic-phosphate processing receiver domain-containing protein [Isosphaeraceae bacterium]|nr:cyclic-phosphate processing receiver domain-containing protein [Isosphaeraceae bacterium]
MRRLFLDDDPLRAEAFLREHPGTVWVTNVADCLARLEETWDEVHLDHDLNGEMYVDISRDDCGMEIVRRLINPPRKHLASTRFYIHSHNASAAYMMMLQLKSFGYRAVLAPFGAPRKSDSRTGSSRPGWLGMLGRLFGRGDSSTRR